MKKLIAILMVLAMLLMTAACGNGNNGGTENNGTGDHSQENVDNNQSGDDTTEEQGGHESSGKITVDTVSNAPETDASEFDYWEVDGGVSITEYFGEAAIVVIPEQIEGMDVVAIDQGAFSNNKTMKGIKIADTVKVINEKAFINCRELLVVVCGASVKEIDDYAFNGCVKLDTMVLNDGIEVLDQCFTLTNITEIEIPASVTEMEFPFVPNDKNHYITIISEAGSYVEQYVNEHGEDYQWIFQAK